MAREMACLGALAADKRFTLSEYTYVLAMCLLIKPHSVLVFAFDEMWEISDNDDK